jgi:hypothetical protein
MGTIQRVNQKEGGMIDVIQNIAIVLLAIGVVFNALRDRK